MVLTIVYKKYVINYVYMYSTVALVNNIHEEQSFMYLSDDLRGLAGTNSQYFTGGSSSPPSLIRHKNAATRLERPPPHGETISGGDQLRCRQLILWRPLPMEKL